MNLVKSTGTFGFYTIISRILGYLRDVLIAIFLGTSFLADVFFVAFRIPNTFRRLFAEGTFNAAFIPSYTSELVKKKSGSQKFANEIFNLLFLGLLFLVLIFILFFLSFNSKRQWSQTYKTLSKTKAINNNLIDYISKIEQIYINELESLNRYRKTKPEDLIYLDKLT